MKCFEICALEQYAGWGACSVHRNKEMHEKLYSDILKERDHFVYQVIKM